MIVSINDEIFSNMSQLRDFLLENEVINRTRVCSKCGCNAVLLMSDSSFSIHYRCRSRTCQKTISLYHSKLPFTRLVHAIYLILSDVTYTQIYWFYGFSDCTTAKIKKKLSEVYRMFLNKRPLLLGGIGQQVQVDETVLSRRGVIRSPTSTDDETRDTVWIVGVVEPNNVKRFVLRRVVNRRIGTLTDALGDVIHVGSKMLTDGHPSYPGVANNIGTDHHIVNHSIGFTNESGEHTNNIEAFWAHLKATMRREHGVKRTNIDNWLICYTFKRRFLYQCTQDELGLLFVEVLRLFFN